MWRLPLIYTAASYSEKSLNEGLVKGQYRTLLRVSCNWTLAIGKSESIKLMSVMIMSGTSGHYVFAVEFLKTGETVIAT